MCLPPEGGHLLSIQQSLLPRAQTLGRQFAVGQPELPHLVRLGDPPGTRGRPVGLADRRRPAVPATRLALAQLPPGLAAAHRRGDGVDLRPPAASAPPGGPWARVRLAAAGADRLTALEQECARGVRPHHALQHSHRLELRVCLRLVQTRPHSSQRSRGGRGGYFSPAAALRWLRECLPARPHAQRRQLPPPPGPPAAPGQSSATGSVDDRRQFRTELVPGGIAAVRRVHASTPSAWPTPTATGFAP
jgi:hypothetical protein